MLKSFRKNPFLLGVFNGFLPCPLVYAFLMRALFEQNPVKGMVVMILFGIGTVPAMLYQN
ncbi:sulfite exporter TauE/SafE family protein [Venenivibrio stagnispumantis]|uniref:sulfite exporter TauE/SafE family protein n=1 Tax=Venenivibrio stagnispumantis TaxID=407998 RepID=UPI002235530C|nr:sulfite exporter TauE/SafE family protein [Venenivibrio stagnispumantis]MCW4573875.1 sulfite exporter TauE/SafE family protein [Venenivibrio stagnispumantis]